MLFIEQCDLVLSIAPAIIAAGIGAAGTVLGGMLSKSNSDSNRKLSREALEQEKEIAENNLQFQKDAFEYQKELNEETMSREDSAVQRRVADLKAAGLNPVLAAGSSAETSSYRAGTAPQMASGHFGEYAQRQIAIGQQEFDRRLAFANLALDFFSRKADISRTEAEADLLRSRAKWNEEQMPRNIENMDLSNAFLRETFSSRVALKYSELSNSQKQELLNDRRKELLDKQIDYEDVRYLLGYADYLLAGTRDDYLKKHMDKMDKELLVMDSLLRARDLEYSIDEWNFNYYKGKNLPTNYRDPTEIKIFRELVNGSINDELSAFFNSIFEVFPDDVKSSIQRNLDNYQKRTGKPLMNFVPTKNNMKYVKGKTGYQTN